MTCYMCVDLLFVLVLVVFVAEDVSKPLFPGQMLKDGAHFELNGN